MNFLCDKCKQKYHVADEKLAGRAVTRFRCKKCDNVIELQAPTPGPATASSPPSASSSSPPSTSATTSSMPVTRAATAAMPVARSGAGGVRARPSTSTGPAYGSSARSSSAPGSATRSAHSGSVPSENGWYAGIRDVPVGPLSRKDLAARVAAGDVAPDTLVWREGLDDWRPLQAIAELGDILASSPSATESARPLPRAQSSAASQVPRPSIDDDDDEATRVSGLDPSLAGLMARSLRPGEKPVTKPVAAADKPRPGSPSLSPLARGAPSIKSAPPAAPKATESASEKPSERSAVFPPPAKPAPDAASRASSKPFGEDSRPSGTSPVSVAERPPSDALLASGPVERAPVTKPPTMDELNAALPYDLFVPSAARASPVPTRSPSVAQPVDALVMPDVPPTTSGALTGPDLAPPPVPAPHEEKGDARGLPMSAWVLMVGVLVAGVGGGVYIGRHNQPTVQPEPPRPLRLPRPPEPPRPVPLATPDASAAATDASAVTAGDAPLGASAPASPRHAEIAQGFRDSRVVDACWQATLQQNPSLPTSTVTIDVHVDARGRYETVSVSDCPDPRFEACLRARIAGIAPVSPGAAADARTSVRLAVRN